MSEPRYRPLKRLEAGGMAEVFVAEALSLQGFKKRVAIKRVLPHLASNKNFIGMFLDEARLGARLNHANVVTVFDIGQADNTYFIVMEYVDGCNLKKVIEWLRQAGRQFPLKEAIYICIEACRGLGFAHDITDDDGVILNIVHRDVSPPNILISKRGEVKVTDFGLAKATTQLEKTDPGVVKGKFSYLSPEAALGQEVDSRADIFALGIVLWEMLAGRRLFLGESDFQTVKLVQQANVPSIQRLNPEADSEFEQILGRALARDPESRYQTAREFADALAGYLFSRKLKVTSYDIAHIVKSACADDPAVTVGSQQSLIDKLISEELLHFTSIDDKSVNLGEASPDQADGARPLDAGSFENPAAWFADEDFGGQMSESGHRESPGGWVESGVEPLGDAVEPDPTPVRTQKPRTEAQPAPRAPLKVEARPDGDGEAEGSGKMLAIVGGVVALVAGAVAAYFIVGG